MNEHGPTLITTGRFTTPFRLAVSAAFAAISLVLPSGLFAEPYRLHAQDRLMIRVLTWDYGQNSLTGW